MRVLLACAGGMSTSLLMNKMMAEGKARGIDLEVRAVPEKTIESHLGTFDVLLLGPQVRFMLKKAQTICQGHAPVDVVPMKDYGTMNGAAVLDFAIKLYQDYYGRAPE